MPREPEVSEVFKTLSGAGFILQIDDPRLATYYMMHPELSVADGRRWAAEHVEVINDSLRAIPREKVRFHTCYSIDVGPRIHEMDLKDIVDILLKINAGAYSFEAANPRHEHEYPVFEGVKLPADKILIPGVISHTTNLVEHPELIAETDPAVRKNSRARERHRGSRLRLCRLRPALQRYPSQRRLAKVCRLGGGRPIGERRAVELTCR